MSFVLRKAKKTQVWKFFLSLDGVTETHVLSSATGFFEDNAWVNVVVTYNELIGSVSLFADGDLVASTTGHYFTGSQLSSRFSSLVLGGGNTPVSGIIDDLRVYLVCLDSVDVSKIFGLEGEI